MQKPAERGVSAGSAGFQHFFVEGAQSARELVKGQASVKNTSRGSSWTAYLNIQKTTLLP